MNFYERHERLKVADVHKDKMDILLMGENETVVWKKGA
jgi:hypothetical protein